MTIKFRQAKPEDLEGLAELLSELFSIEMDFSVDRTKQLQGLALLLRHDQESYVLVAELEDKKIVGMSSLQQLISTAEGGYVGLVEDVIVSKTYRGRGIGTQLLASIEQIAVDKGYQRLQLLCDVNNSDAQRFYGKTGWGKTKLIALRKKFSHKQTKFIGRMQQAKK